MDGYVFFVKGGMDENVKKNIIKVVDERGTGDDPIFMDITKLDECDKYINSVKYVRDAYFIYEGTGSMIKAVLPQTSPFYDEEQSRPQFLIAIEHLGHLFDGINYCTVGMAEYYHGHVDENGVFMDE